MSRIDHGVCASIGVSGQVELSYTLWFKVSKFALLAVSRCLKELRAFLSEKYNKIYTVLHPLLCKVYPWKNYYFRRTFAYGRYVGSIRTDQLL